MACALVIILALAVAPDGNTPPKGILASGQAAASSPSNSQPLDDAVHAALRRRARPTDEEAKPAARELLAVYGALEQDGHLPKAQRERLRVQVRRRLLKLADQITYVEAVEKRNADMRRPKSVQLPDGKPEALAQIQGGPAQRGQAGFGGGPPDAGEQLVDLIQRTIAPSTWDVNGGPGAIYYWRPGRALSVRQTSEVHHRLGGLLDQIRQMQP
ncbi:MAG: hypothetical protein HUU20_12335 [Pirellulales bacterium]|nr:hypothetical protein [Pirellulales bacterium]